MTTTTIIKIQVPLYSTSPGKALCLVYDEKREHELQQSILPETATAIGRDVKAYFEAAWDERAGTWNVGKRVERQAW